MYPEAAWLKKDCRIDMCMYYSRDSLWTLNMQERKGKAEMAQNEDMQCVCVCVCVRVSERRGMDRGVKPLGENRLNHPEAGSVHLQVSTINNEPIG